MNQCQLTLFKNSGLVSQEQSWIRYFKKIFLKWWFTNQHKNLMTQKNVALYCYVNTCFKNIS